jgi:hypothetical protein
MKIVGIDRMSTEQINAEVQRGARFVVYPYCISVLVMSFKRSSNIHFVPAGESAAGRRAAFSGVSLLLGWWGIPWGPIWTIGTVFSNLNGGTDVTADVLASMRTRRDIAQAPRPGAF